MASPEIGEGVPSNGSPVLFFEEVFKKYRLGAVEISALAGITLSVHRGELLAVMGPSGSGKTTLLNLAGGLDRATAGKVFVDGEALGDMGERALTLLRRRKIGFVFQDFNLLPNLTALENVCLPLLLDGRSYGQVQARGRELLETVGLAKRGAHRPDHLSGGEIQRVALARALIMKPKLILADEPTGNLDTSTGEAMLALLRDRVRNDGVTLVLVTHSEKAASYAHRVIDLQDGRIQRTGRPEERS